MSILKQTILTELNEALDVPLMDVMNVSNIIFNEYIKEEVFMYWRWREGFFTIYTGGKQMGFIPDNDPELLDRVRELVNLGWDNSNKNVRLDITSWKTQGSTIRNIILNTL